MVTSPPLGPYPSSITPPRMNPVLHPASTGYISPQRAEPLSPQRQHNDLQPQRSPPRAVPPPGTTAEDLLKGVLGRTPGIPQHTHTRGASVARSPFSLGSGLGTSIWSSDQGDSAAPSHSYVHPSPHGLQSPISPTNGSPFPPPVARPTAPLSSHGLPPAQRPWASQSQPQSTQTWPAQALNTTAYTQTGHLGAPFVPEQLPIGNVNGGLGGQQRLQPDTNAVFPRATTAYSLPPSAPAPALQYDPFGYDIRTPLPEVLGSAISPNGGIGRVPGTSSFRQEQQLPSPSRPVGFGYSVNSVESAFYNAPNIEPSAQGLRRDRLMMSPPYDPHVWGNTG